MIGWAIVLIALIAIAPYAAEWMRPRIDARARAAATGDFVELSDGLTYYQWRGPSRGPIVVGVHGLTTPSYIWTPLAVALTALGVRVLTYDLYGRGLSDRPPGPQDRAFFVRQLDELLTALEITQGVTVMGYSMGGAIATAFAADHPERVDRLVLVAPVGLGHRMGPFLRFCAKTPVLGDWLVRVFGGAVHWAGVNRRLPENPELPDFTTRMARAMRFRGTLPAVLSSLRNMMAEDMAPTHRKLGQTTLPVLAVWAEDDAIIPLSGIGKLAQIYRDARQVEVPGATHLLPFTHPADVMASLTEVLREPV